MSNESQFIDTSKEVKDTMVKLAKTALRKAGKVAGKKIKENTKVRTAKLQNMVGYWARINRQTGQPELQIGFFSKANARKKGRKPSHANPAWLEFGTKGHSVKAGVISSRGSVRGTTNKKALANVSTGEIFGASTNHPGARANNTLRNSVFDNIEEIRSAEEETLAKLNEEIGIAKGYIEESEEDESV